MPLPRLLAVAVLAVALLVGVAPPAQAGDTVLSGTLYGADGRAVSALLGFDLKDAKGRTLGASGCVKSPSCPVEGYAVTKRVNFDLGPDGAEDTARWSVTWSVALPQEAERVYVEVYPQGRGYAGTDRRRYAPSFRRNLDLPYRGRVNLRLPLVSCPGRGDVPRVGFVNGYAVDEDRRRVPLRRVTAFSMEPDNNAPDPVLGFGVGSVEPNGYFHVGTLAAGRAPGQREGQRYQLIATAADGRVSRVYGVRVQDCRGVRQDIVFPS